MSYFNLDMEQKIMNCWSTSDDIKLLFETVMESEKFDLDELSNALLGLSTIHDLRMEQLWQLFEGMVCNGKY